MTLQNDLGFVWNQDKHSVIPKSKNHFYFVPYQMINYLILVDAQNTDAI